METLWAIFGVVLALVVPGLLLVLVPERSEKDPANPAVASGPPIPWRNRVSHRLQQRRLLLLIYLGLVAVAALGLVIWVLPAALTHGQYRQDADRMKAQSDARGNLVTLVGGLALIGGLAFTASTYRLGQENHRLSQETYRLSRESQITDRYSKAVEQLGDEKIEVRLGGIYALERLMRDSSADQPTIMETLAAFVRQHAPRSPWPALPARGAPPSTPDHSVADVQAVLMVLRRRHPVENERPIDLSRTDLSRADLTEATLTGAHLTEATLTGAWLIRVNLTNARLGRANLTHAWLGQADLTRAWLGQANLTDVSLNLAVLRGAVLSLANLTDAGLVRANLANADLRGAILCGSNLAGAILTGADVRGAILAGADLREANLTNASLSGGTLTNGSLSEEQLASAKGSDQIKWVSPRQRTG